MRNSTDRLFARLFQFGLKDKMQNKGFFGTSRNQRKFSKDNVQQVRRSGRSEDIDSESSGKPRNPRKAFKQEMRGARRSGEDIQSILEEKKKSFSDALKFGFDPKPEENPGD
jgi:hypothetical protein